MSPEKLFGVLACVGLLIVTLWIGSRGKRERERVSPDLDPKPTNTVLKPGPHAPQKRVILGFDPAYFEYGTIVQGQSIEHDFRLVNRSTNAMRIVAVRASCSCTLISTGLVDTVLAPNEETTVPVKYESGSREGGASSTVEVVMTLDGVANSPRYKTEAVLHSTVNPDFVIEPRALDFGTMLPNERQDRVLKFQLSAIDYLELTVHSNALGSSFVVNVDHSKKAPLVSVQFHAPQTTYRELVSATLNIETSSKRVPLVSIPVRAQVVPEIEASPEVLVLPSERAGGESRVTILSKYPSRITRMFTRNGDTTKDLQLTGSKTSPWEPSHDVHVANSFLSSAESLEFLLDVQTKAGRTEARSASVKIRSLGER